MDEKYEYIINASSDFITLIDRNYVYTVVNDSYCKAISKTKADIINRTVAEVWGEDKFQNPLKGYLDRCFSGEEVHYIEKFKFGVYLRYMHVSYYPYYDETRQEVTHVCVFSHDITKLGEIETKLINYEYRDPVTGLFNRRSLEIILDMELEKARRSEYEKLRAVLYIGIENLSDINRRHGHSIGNILIENAGVKIKEILRNSDYIFRCEGNELVVILTRLTRNTDAAKVAEKVYDEITSPHNYQNFTISLRCHIGIAIFPEDGDTRTMLIGNAIAALNEAKQQSKWYLLYDKKIHEEAVKKLTLERDLYNAFQGGEFELNYQPIVNIKGKIIGAEALIRWNHQIEGVIGPHKFIPLAEEIGLIKEIGKWALFTSTKQLRRWIDFYELYMSINLSAPEFENEELPDVLQAALRQAENLPSRYVKFEITESEEMIKPEHTLQRMEELTALGVEIYIDDFGTGLSSLSYLKRLPASALKIDKVFIDEIENDESEREFLKNIINLAKSRDKTIIVEGVNSYGQYTILRRLHCDLMQGFYFSPPLTAKEFEQILKNGGNLLPDAPM